MTSPELLRFCLTVQYDGSPFHGWQRQKADRTVQGELEAVLLELTRARRPVVGSGRTDTGVHALGQVASVEVPERWSAAQLRSAMNARLPAEIWVSEVRRAAPGFHPRYDAITRSYEYRLGTDREAASPFCQRWCWNTSEDSPDPRLLAEAAQMIKGERSFRSFAKAGQPTRGERCRVMESAWSPWSTGAGPGLRFLITADRYLHHMVRYLVGTMVEVARGRRPLQDMRDLLEHPGGSLVTSPPAPPEGLFLRRVEYPPERIGDHPDRAPQQDGDQWGSARTQTVEWSR
ncbi:MAG: tRNA pseudouridine(38-40) synthase TruA [Gemmatimonadetes bacterium]|nr:tRNA pseudouridine(38-40) synthase TruA [Gemmatimonadota bacterium]